jgi:hypothetical protein
MINNRLVGYVLLTVPVMDWLELVNDASYVIGSAVFQLE